MNEPINPTPGALRAMFPELQHVLENELLRFQLEEKIHARYSLITGKRTKLYIRLTEDHLMEIRPTDLLDGQVPTWFLDAQQVNKESGEKRAAKLFRANVVVRRALPEDSTVIFSHTLMAPNLRALLDMALKCVNAKNDLTLSIVKIKTSRTKKD